MSLPYLPLFVDDYEADTAHLSLMEDGIYSRLLRLCWRTPRCRLPNDREWIARKIRANGSEELKALDVVLAEFFTLSRGVVFSKRLLAEHKRISVSIQRRKEAGKSGGLAKALKSKETVPSNARAKPKHPEPEPYPEEKADAFSGRASARKNSGFVTVRKTTDALNDVLQELDGNDQRRIGFSRQGDVSDVPVLPAIRTG